MIYLLFTHHFLTTCFFLWPKIILRFTRSYSPIYPKLLHILHSLSYQSTKICEFHSHKKRRDSLETRAILTEIFMLCWNLPSGSKHRRLLQKKNIDFPEGNKLLAGDFRANMNETNADIVHFTKRWSWKWIF